MQNKLKSVIFVQASLKSSPRNFLFNFFLSVMHPYITPFSNQPSCVYTHVM